MARKTKRDPLSMVRPHFKDLVPYVPIIPTAILQRDTLARIVKLDGNENPYGPSPRALAALQQYQDYHIYPDPLHRELRPMLADYVGVTPDRVIPGNGSDEIIDLLMRLFLEAGDIVINCPPSFGMYPFNTQVCGGALVEIPRRADFTLDLETVVNGATKPRAKLLFLASPNNPTGNLLSRDELNALLGSGIVVVVDEAYQEFAGVPSFASLVMEHENLVVLRTFSKWAGLAGLRLGYGVMAPSLVCLLDQIKPPYNVNVAALTAAKVSLEDKEYLLERVGRIVQERGRLCDLLRGVSYLEPIHSEANFILCRVHGRDAGVLKGGLASRGVFVKHVDTEWLPNCLRISVGAPQDTDTLMEAFKTL